MTVKAIVMILAVLFLASWASAAYAAEEVVYDFPLKKSQWEYWEEGGARAKLKSVDSKFVLNILASPAGAFHHIQLYKLALKIEEGQKYMLRLDATSDKEAEISCKFHKASPNWVSYQNPEYVVFDLSPRSNSKTEEFVAERSTDQARLTCYFGQNRGETNITINSLRLLRVNGATKK